MLHKEVRKSSFRLFFGALFPTDGYPAPSYIASWASVTPENNESAGKRMSGKTTKGNSLLRIPLIITILLLRIRATPGLMNAEHRRIRATPGLMNAEHRRIHSPAWPK